MSRNKSRLTVFFEEPFWVGVFEQETDGVICAARVVFGAQPTDAEVFEFVLRHADRLRYGPPVEGRLSRETANPKKRRREAARETAQRGIGTRSQQALQLAREQNRLEKRESSRARRQAEQARRFALRTEKRREKHRGH